jgi:hypothetical protein
MKEKVGFSKLLVLTAPEFPRCEAVVANACVDWKGTKM